MMKDEFFIELFKEEQMHARHTEVQRLEVTKFILVAIGALAGLMATLKFSIYCLPFGALIVVLGFVGRTVGNTYVQRFDDHRGRARAFRSAIDQSIAPVGTAEEVLKKHPVDKDQRVRTFWEGVNRGVIAVGVTCIICNALAIWARVNADHQYASWLEKVFDQLAH